MGKGKDDGDDELQPTDEQKRAYAEMSQAAIALARFDKFCGTLPGAQITTHPTQMNCIIIPSLGQSMVVVEFGNEIGLVVPPSIADWIEDFPFACIGVTKTELFFVTKGFTWLGSEVASFGVSLGSLLPSDLLAALTRQSVVKFFVVPRDQLKDPEQGTLIREERPVPVYKVPDDVDVLATRAHYEALQRRQNITSESVLHDHFLG